MIDAPGDAVRAAELRRIKWLATLLLATTFALFIVARAFVHVHPTLGFVAAALHQPLASPRGVSQDPAKAAEQQIILKGARGDAVAGGGAAGD